MRRLLSPDRWLMLGVCLLLVTGRLYGQREVIATSAAAPVETPVASPTPTPGVIQPVSFVAEPSPRPPLNPTAGAPAANNGLVSQALAASSPPTPAAPTPTPPLPPTPAPIAPLPAPPLPPTPPTPTPPTGAPLLPPSALFGGAATSGSATPQPVNPADVSAAVVSVEVVMPERVLLGQPLTQEIIVRNCGKQSVAELHVEEPLPMGARALRCDPPAVPRDGRLTWELRNLEAGGERRLKVELRPAGEGALDLRPYVTFLPGNTTRTQVVRPPFSIELIANHESVPRNGRILFSIRVANNGDTPVRHIKLYDPLPPGLHHPKGPKIFAGLGDLMPGEARTITLETTALQSGTFRNEVRADADLGIEAKASLDVIVTEPKLAVRVEGPARSVSQRELDFRIELSNPGPLPAKNVLLVQALPPTFEVVSASAGGNLDTDKHALVWSLPELGAGQRQTVTFRGKASAAGDWPFAATVLTQNLGETRAEHTLHVEAAALLRLEVHAEEERLAVNAETVYRMHLFNKGDAPCTGLRLTATLPDAVTVLDAQGGPTIGQIDQHQVHFAPLSELPPHAQTVYRLRVRGRQPGKGSLRVELTADKQSAVQREMSIQVLGETTSVADAFREPVGTRGASAPQSTPSAGRANSIAGETLR